MRTSFGREGEGMHGSFHSWLNAWQVKLGDPLKTRAYLSASVMGLAL